MDTTKKLIENTQTCYEDLSFENRELTKRNILDTLGVMFPAATLDKSCCSIYEIVREHGGIEDSTIIGFGGKGPCSLAAFVNGSLAHALDYDDVADVWPHHPSANVFPAALAVAEKAGPVSGKDFITAIALGNDLSIRLSASVGKAMANHPWFPVTIFGVFSATLGAGKVMRLSEDQMVNAFGIASNRVFGTIDGILDKSSDIRGIRDGFTNRDGVFCALMAGRGIVGSKDGIEKMLRDYYKNEFDSAILLKDLGKDFRGAEVSIKPWPVARETHGYIQAALEIIKEYDLNPDQIEKIIVTVGEFVAGYLCEPRDEKAKPKSSMAAKFSIPFALGVAFTKKGVQIDAFLSDRLGDPNVLAIAGKVYYKVDKEFGVFTPAVVEVRTKGGETFVKRVDTLYGHPQNPIGDADLIAKFKDCVRYGKKPLSLEATEQLIEMVLNFEKVEDIKEFTAPLNS